MMALLQRLQEKCFGRRCTPDTTLRFSDLLLHAQSDNDFQSRSDSRRPSIASVGSAASNVTDNELEANREQHIEQSCLPKLTSIVFWFKIFGLRHSADHFVHRIWAIVCICLSSASFTLPFLWVSATVFDGPVSLFSEVLQKIHDSYPWLCYLCLMSIFCSTSENYIFQHKNSKFHSMNEWEGDQIIESENTSGLTFWQNCKNCSRNTYCRMARAFWWIIKKTFSFEGSTLLLFLGSWCHYVWWFATEAYSAGIPFRSGPLPSGVFTSEEKLYVYLALVSTFPWRVVPPILATHLIVMNFKRFEKLAKTFYLNHRRQPHTPVIIGVVPTQFFSKSGDHEDFLRSRELSTHDLFFMDSVPESRSRDLDFTGKISLTMKLISEETKGLWPLWPKQGTSLKISGTLDFPVKELLKLPDLTEPAFKKPVRWTPFISVCTPGVKIRTSLNNKTSLNNQTTTTQELNELNQLLFRSAYTLSGFKKQDCKSCFEELTDHHGSFLKKGDTHFYETAIMCDSPAPPGQSPQGQHVGFLHDEAELTVKIEQTPLNAEELYQPSTELMSQLVRNGLLEMKTFLRHFRILFWVMVLLPLINMILFILDGLLGGDIKCVHLLLAIIHHI
jgi:hypothetical protein